MQGQQGFSSGPSPLLIDGRLHSALPPSLLCAHTALSAWRLSVSLNFLFL